MSASPSNMHRDKTALVTGANRGIGLEVAVGLARQGMEVLLACRDPASGRAALDRVREASTGPAPALLTVDLSEQRQVRRLAAEVRARWQRLTVLIHNAAIVSLKRVSTPDGLELQLAVNHLAPVLLTHELLPLLQRSTPARIIVTASQVERTGRVTFTDPAVVEPYDADQAYCQSKLANLLFTYELAERLRGSGITANALHPGVVRTQLLDALLANGESARSSPLAGARWLVVNGLRQLGLLPPIRDWALTPEAGAATTIFLATDPGLEQVSGKYFVDRREAQSSPQSQDPALRRTVWDVSARLTGIEAAWAG
jgi:NAD(P)-dependent dehydrogenase (short-subunit alcohol dehydrogenase family)